MASLEHILPASGAASRRAGEARGSAATRALAVARSWLDALAVVFAQPLFCSKRMVGLVVFAGICTTPSCIPLAACSLASAELCQRALKLARGYTPYNYNALLCGIALGNLYEVTPRAAAFGCALGGFSVLVTAAIASFAAAFNYIPIAAIPYTLTTWCALGIAPYVGLVPAWLDLDPLANDLPQFAALWLQSLGTLVLVPRVLAGAAILAALLLHSRIASIVTVGALTLSLGVLQLSQSALTDALVVTIGANAALTALALGGVWLVPSRATTLVAFGGALLATFFALGSAGPLYQLGLWPGFLPAGVVLVVVVTALRQRSQQHVPHIAETVADDPEQLLLDHLARPRKHATGVYISPPFYGFWSCTQGANGPFTHQGSLAHAYDFEVYDDVHGSLCRSHGETPQDFHCFAQPVLAAADGTVIAIENTQPNNPIGEMDSSRPWGNYVIVQHNPACYSLVAHLAPGTVTVYPGQFVARSSVLGYCGSSGRSPRPHLHFQLQTSPAIGSPTIPCELQDVIIGTAGRLRFKPLHEAGQGEAIRALAPDYGLAALFDVPLGATLTYRVGTKTEQIVCELDAWGRTRLRSLQLDAQLVFLRSGTCLRSTELRGSAHSVLRLWRLALGLVPFERIPGLKFGSSVPRRWVTGVGRGLLWELGAALSTPGSVTLESQLQIEPDGLSVTSISEERDTTGEPLLHATAHFSQWTGSATTGPRVLEVTTNVGARRTWRAELVLLGKDVSGPRQLITQDIHQAPPGFALEVGDWS